MVSKSKRELAKKIISYVKNTKALNQELISMTDLSKAEQDLKIDKYYIMVYIRFRNKSLLQSIL